MNFSFVRTQETRCGVVTHAGLFLFSCLSLSLFSPAAALSDDNSDNSGSCKASKSAEVAEDVGEGSEFDREAERVDADRPSEECYVRVRLLQGSNARAQGSKSQASSAGSLEKSSNRPLAAAPVVNALVPVSGDLRGFAHSRFTIENGNSAPSDEPVDVDANDDPALADLRPQLDGLPHARYRVLSAEEKHFPLGGQAEFELPTEHGGEHMITVIAHERMAEKVRLGLSWDGPNGESLLQTHLSVKNGHNIVVGADGAVAGDTADHSTVVCVTVKCE